MGKMKQDENVQLHQKPEGGIKGFPFQPAQRATWGREGRVGISGVNFRGAFQSEGLARAEA